MPRADTFTYAIANNIAVRIAKYWTERGLVGVQAWAEPIIHLGDAINDNQGEIYQVRSNIAKLCRS